MKYISKISYLLIILAALSSNLTAQIVIDKPSKVMDHGKLFSKHEKNLLNLLLDQLKKKTKAEMFILTVDKLENETIEQIGIRLIDHWNKKDLAPGSKQRDDGLLFIISKTDREMRLEVGQGLEGKITDHKAGNIIRLLPEYFKKGQFYEGTAKAVNECAKLINNTELSYPKSTKKSKSSKKLGDPILVFLFILIILSSFFNNRRGGGIYISTGGFSGGFSGGGGGFSGGGGGGFSGGGASGSW